jgi:hypothetical protein
VNGTINDDDDDGKPMYTTPEPDSVMGDDLIKREHFIGMRLDKVDNLTGFSNTIENHYRVLKRLALRTGW